MEKEEQEEEAAGLVVPRAGSQLARSACSRRASRRLAGKLGTIGRLASSGRIGFDQAAAAAAGLLSAAAAEAGRPGDEHPYWMEARSRARAQEESLYFHVKHVHTLGRPIGKARLAAFLAKGSLDPLEVRRAAQAHT